MSEPEFIVPPPGLVPGEPGADRARHDPSEPETAREPGAAGRSERTREPEAPDHRPEPAAAEPEGTVRAERSRPSFHSPIGIRPPSALPLPPSASPPPARVDERWQLRSADGVEIPVDGRVVAGRDPRPPNWLSGATPVVVDDPSRSMSKTHALLEAADGGRLVATDLDSTNGVRVWPEGAEPIDLEPGVPTEVPRDAVVLLGDVAFLAERLPRPRG
ncbi:FHA domain-containing protein [Agromyces tropicus]|uniref:FHA domain-containing protein n=1 Tax=Agromyces tropicus TaxID=555371 RepID=UPI0031CDF0A6